MAENTRTLPEIFKKLAPSLTGTSREIFETATDIKLKISREARIAEISCALPRLYTKREIYALENKIKEEYELVTVRILPRYPSELFSVGYMSDVLAEAGRVGVVANGFFDKFVAEEKGGTITLSIPFSSGGIGLLDLAKTADVISGIIRSEFSLTYKIEIKSSANAEEEYAAFMAKQLADLNSASDYIVSEHDRMVSEAADAARLEKEAKEEETKNAHPRVASLFDGSENAEFIEDGVYKCGKITFDTNSREVVFGEEFTVVDPLPLRSVKTTAKNVIILCEVFDIQQKETRRGDKVMFTVAATDKDTSIYIKMTVPLESAPDTEALFSKGKAYAVRGNIKRDTFDNDLYMQYTDIMQIKERVRMDKAPEKRVELHLHTDQSAVFKPFCYFKGMSRASESSVYINAVFFNI